MKRQYCLYLDIEPIEICRSKGLNISTFINAILLQEAELKNNNINEPISALKIANAKIMAQLNALKLENIELKKKINEKTEKGGENDKPERLEYTFGKGRRRMGINY